MYTAIIAIYTAISAMCTAITAMYAAITAMYAASHRNVYRHHRTANRHATDTWRFAWPGSYAMHYPRRVPLRFGCGWAVVIAVTACTNTTTVTVELANDPPTLIAYRTGTSAWKIPTPRDGGTYAAHHYELDVSDDYEVVAAATNVEGTGLTYSYELLATVDDGTRWYLQAGGAIDLTVSTPGPSTPSDDGLCTFTNEPQIYSGGITVSGVMAQPGEVSFGTFCEEPLGTTTGSWSYAIATPPGTGDLIATNGARFSIMRSLDFQQSATVPTIDLTSGGEPFASQSVTVVNTGVYPNDEGPIGSELQLFTSHGGAILTTEQDEVASTSHVVPLVPSSTLVTGDRELLTVSVQDTSNATRSGWTYAPTATSTFLLLDEPTAAGAVSNGVATVTWSGELDPRVQFVNINSTYNVSTPTFSYFSQGVTATPHWLAAHSATSLGFDSSVPGYNASWDIEGGPTTGTSFSVSAIGPQDGGYSTTRTLPLR